MELEFGHGLDGDLTDNTCIGLYLALQFTKCYHAFFLFLLTIALEVGEVPNGVALQLRTLTLKKGQ